MRRFLKILFSIPGTLYFNFRYLPLNKAIHLPIWIASNVKIKRLHRGGLVGDLDALGIVRIGYHEADAVDVYSAHTILDISRNGKVFFQHDAHIGQGALICVKDNGILTLGKNFAISGTTKIICAQHIEIGADVQFSWDTLVMDSDAHTLLEDDKTPIVNISPVILGNHIWIASNCTLLKGCQIADNCVVACHSLVNKKICEPNCLIGGTPAKVLRKIGGWHI